MLGELESLLLIHDVSALISVHLSSPGCNAPQTTPSATARPEQGKTRAYFVMHLVEEAIE